MLLAKKLVPDPARSRLGRSSVPTEMVDPPRFELGLPANQAGALATVLRVVKLVSGFCC